MLDLNPNYLVIIKKILAEHVPNTTVWAYGSRVKGNAHECSDLDLVIINPNNPSLPQDNLARLRAAFSESNLPILVDIFDWAEIPDSFKQEIERSHETIQKCIK